MEALCLVLIFFGPVCTQLQIAVTCSADAARQQTLHAWGGHPSGGIASNEISELLSGHSAVLQQLPPVRIELPVDLEGGLNCWCCIREWSLCSSHQVTQIWK